MDLKLLIEKTAEGLGFEVIDIESSPRGRLLRVFIDKPEGITVEDCATVSNQLTRLFEVENIDYDRLEVSSPGLDRPLTKLAHFERFAGEEVQLRVRIPVANQRNFSGTLRGVDGETVILETATGEQRFAFDDVERARIVPKF
ncbi:MULTISPECIES: ribosome maturation factor RimP [Niveibacterium]|uniref:Ribosome maturation factor RimP n=1 Tax=Niveibacterium microcysteis TaxID=2811415 RepID=A0ABX7MC88_9RHOO|nr:ribosome maturation factor RimP [Niveibacterium microcysteis]QSI77872.1 ribosome maturation factor RimP [Niveibacterium microcysteis]QSI79342.1 ribosome maturation factor RimP [Niveibacterium microcysteis]